ncbi:hypothetical protein D1872_249070 [compost metagenome]
MQCTHSLEYRLTPLFGRIVFKPLFRPIGLKTTLPPHPKIDCDLYKLAHLLIGELQKMRFMMDKCLQLLWQCMVERLFYTLLKTYLIGFSAHRTNSKTIASCGFICTLNTQFFTTATFRCVK